MLHRVNKSIEAYGLIAPFSLPLQCPWVIKSFVAFSFVLCSVHHFCLVTGSEEEPSPVLKALERSAARKMPSKSLEDISSDSSSENKVCPTVRAPI